MSRSRTARPRKRTPAPRSVPPRPRYVRWVAAAVVAAIVAALVAALAANHSSGGGSGGPGRGVAPAGVVDAVSHVPASVFDTVGVGTIAAAPRKLPAPALRDGSKPLVVYIGAEYCPYCATERWPMVIALSRFGSFTNLGLTRSASNDAYPDTQTFSFHGASYTSTYLSFQGVETYTRTGNPLDAPTAAQQQLASTWDVPPYTSRANAIPFIDFGGRYVISGATYDPNVLHGKSAQQIADALADPTSDIAKGAVGAANTITAAICKLTNGQPASVCASPAVSAIGARLG